MLGTHFSTAIGTTSVYGLRLASTLLHSTFSHVKVVDTFITLLQCLDRTAKTWSVVANLQNTTGNNVEGAAHQWKGL